jgi:hypothetical protein
MTMATSCFTSCADGLIRSSMLDQHVAGFSGRESDRVLAGVKLVADETTAASMPSI